MKRNLSSLLTLCLFIGSFFMVDKANAQQDAEFSMYMFNGLYTNPAYAGSKETPYLTGIYRHQWVGIPGAPRSANIAFHTPLKKDQNAVGAILRFDKLGLLNSYGLDLSYAYRIRVKDKMKISLGLQASATNFQNKLSDANTVQSADPMFQNNVNLILPNVGAGIYMYNNKFYFGASVPHLLNLSLMNKKIANVPNNSDYLAKQYNHWFATAGVVLGKNERIKFKPSVQLKYVRNAPLQFDLNASVLFVERIWVGASYREGGDIYNTSGVKVASKGESVIGMLRFLVTKRMELGYAYDYTLSGLNAYNSGTHEVMIGYDLGKKNDNRFVTPRYVTYF